MKPISLRTLVSTIGIVVATIIFVSVPTGYFIVGYAKADHDLDFKAHLTADRVAKYVYLHRDLWQYQAVRLAELIEISEAEGEGFAQQVLDNENNIVIRAGPRLQPPTMTERFPIVVSGAVVGQVEAEHSLRPLLVSTGLVAVFGALLSFGVYFAIRIFPLKVLDRTLGALHESQRSLAAQVASRTSS